MNARPIALRPDAPIVTERVDAFYQKLGLVKPWQHPDLKWIGIVVNGVVGCVVSIFIRADNSIEVTNFYPVPTREGVKAGYAGLAMLKEMVDEKIIPYWIGPIPFKNKFGRRHVERFFGIKPRSLVYVYDGSHE